MAEFTPFGKIPRLNRELVVTEKIDGTNSQIFIEHLGTSMSYHPSVALVGDFTVAAGSRNRYITPEDDNFGFAAWVQDHAEDLVEGLGEGRHYGEWWGHKIGRGYGLTERRFSLFNVDRWDNDKRPKCCHVVPVLSKGMPADDPAGAALTNLRLYGSAAALGFNRPEGIIVYHTAGNHLYKVTLEKDDMPKILAHGS